MFIFRGEEVARTLLVSKYDFVTLGVIFFLERSVYNRLCLCWVKFNHQNWTKLVLLEFANVISR